MELKKQKGFTLIELLVVVAIISLLSSIVYASLNSVRAKARDAKRLTELRQIRNALELYRGDYNTYPNYSTGQTPTCSALGWAAYYTGYTNCWTDLQTKLQPYISTLPLDPKASLNAQSVPSIGGGNYDMAYWYLAVGQGYILLMRPENNALLAQDENCYLGDTSYYCIGNQ